MACVGVRRGIQSVGSVLTQILKNHVHYKFGPDWSGSDQTQDLIWCNAEDTEGEWGRGEVGPGIRVSRFSHRYASHGLGLLMLLKEKPKKKEEGFL